MAFLTVLALALALPIASGKTDLPESRAGKRLEIENGSFQPSGIERKPVEGWTFEAISVITDATKLSFDVKIGKDGGAALALPSKGRGVLLTNRSDTSRANLVSTPFEIEPFRWAEVTVEYGVEKGEPVPFVSLQPRKKRALTDLAFLPPCEPGKTNRATLKLHSGSSSGYYTLSVCCVGSGTVRFLSIKAEDAGAYPRPEKPVFVLDMMHMKPRPKGRLGWDNIEKLVTVFGFPSVEFLHFSEVTKEKLEKIDPALVILSPKGEEVPRSEVEKLLEGVRISVDHGAPVVGICMGHQVLALLQGGRLGGVMTDGPGGEVKMIWEWGPTMVRAAKKDPLFAGLPRYPLLCISESHRAMVDSSFEGAELLASTALCRTQIYRYREKPWYTFQAHIEREWEYTCPEASLLWKNMLRHFFLIP